MPKRQSKISEVIPLTKDQNNLILTYFQNGEYHPSQASKMKSCLLRDNDAQENSDHVLLSTSDTQVYSGRVGEGFSNLVNTFVAIRNKKTNKVRLVGVQQCSMLNSKLGELESSISLSAEVNQKLQMKVYGTKLKGRIFDRYVNSQLNMDFMKENVTKKIEEMSAKIKKENLENQESLKAKEQSIAPSMNTDANNIKDLYDIMSLLSESLVEELEESARALIDCEINDLPIQSSFIVSKIAEIRNSANPKSEDNLKRVKMCIYMDALTNIVQRQLHNLNHPFSDIAECVEADIRANYIVAGQTILKSTAFTKNKAICHIIVLAMLLSEDLSVNLLFLASSLKTSVAELMKFAKFVGAHPAAPASSVVFLCLPGTRPKKEKIIKKEKKDC